MIDLFKYLFLSENKGVYRSIAKEVGVQPVRVYRLAHGKKAKNYKDYQILKCLKETEIIEGLSH